MLALAARCPMTVKVRQLIDGEDAITLEDGQLVYDRVHPELLAGRAVTLDFTGVTVFASPFFNGAIGQLLRDLQPDALNRLLQVVNLDPTGMDVVRQVIANSKRYYAEPNYRAAQEKVLAALSFEG